MRSGAAGSVSGLWGPTSLSPPGVTRRRFRLGRRSRPASGGRFFYARPFVGHPVRDRLVVALHRTSGRTLTAPGETLAHDLPRLGLGIPHPGRCGDHFRDARQGPEVRRVPVGPRPLAQLPDHNPQLLVAQPGKPTRPPRARQRGLPALAPDPIPLAHRRRRHTKRSCHISLALPPTEHLRRSHTPTLQRLEVTTRTLRRIALGSSHRRGTRHAHILSHHNPTFGYYRKLFRFRFDEGTSEVRLEVSTWRVSDGRCSDDAAGRRCEHGRDRQRQRCGSLETDVVY